MSLAIKYHHILLWHGQWQIIPMKMQKPQDSHNIIINHREIPFQLKFMQQFLKVQYFILSVQFSSVTQLWTILCNPMDSSTPGLPVHHHLLKFTQTHVHWVSDAFQPSIVDTVLLYVDLSSLKIFCLSNITVSLNGSKCFINLSKQHYIPM